MNVEEIIGKKGEIKHTFKSDAGLTFIAFTIADFPFLAVYNHDDEFSIRIYLSHFEQVEKKDKEQTHILSLLKGIANNVHVGFNDENMLEAYIERETFNDVIFLKMVAELTRFAVVANSRMH